MILKVLQKSLPMTAGDVYEAVRKRDTKLSLSTVYRNCEALAKRDCFSVRRCLLTDWRGMNIRRATMCTTRCACRVIRFSLSRFVWNRSIKTVWQKKTDLKWRSIVWKFTVFAKNARRGAWIRNLKNGWFKERQERWSVYDAFFIPCVTEGGI